MTGQRPSGSSHYHTHMLERGIALAQDGESLRLKRDAVRGSDALLARLRATYPDGCPGEPQ